MENSPTLFQILAQKPKRKMLQWGKKKNHKSAANCNKHCMTSIFQQW